ncbi:hypothetical protein EJ065_7258 [Corallococcus coralloides]|uniref:Lipoprotein n=2 Tax=Corallococcus coralloides TaxID=184914 RepID=A0A410S3T0_CORCK|nr:hypothetical protein EJ065_7258 [Corallococcus coralloides]
MSFRELCALMLKIQTYSILSLGLLTLSACQAASSPDGELGAIGTAKVQQAVETPVSRVTAQPTWVGYLKVRSRSSGSWTTPTTANRQWKSSYSFVSPVVVTMIPASMFALVEIKPGFSSFDLVDDSTFQGTSVLKHVAKCFRATPGNFAFMQFPTDSSYSFQPAPFNGSTCWGTGTQGDVTTPSNVGWHAYNTMSFANEFVFPVPAVDAPLRLHHTKHFITVDGAIVQSVPSPLPYGTMPVEWEFEWDLMPEDPDVDLVLSADGYESWLPKATISPGGVSLTSSTQIEPGSTLVVKAKAEPKDPSLPVVAMKQVTFLLGSSSLPGIAMNRRPPDIVMAIGDDADLIFEQDRNAAYGLISVDPTKVETPVGSFTEATAEVSSFDFGGYGHIMAVGITENDRMVYSRIKDPSVPPGSSNPPVEGSLLLPKRSAASYIADSWKSDENSSLKTDDDDSDALPASMLNTHVGDALTLFEEYRGFIIRGAHVRTKPSEPDYFLEDQIKTSESSAGIQRFADATNLKVHLLEGTDYLLNDRVINGNHQGGVHGGNKYLVLMRSEWEENGTSNAVGGPGTPKAIDRVAIASNARDGTVVSTIAHELGHTVNLHHHGEGAAFLANWDDIAGGRAEELPIKAPELDPGTIEIYYETLFARANSSLAGSLSRLMIGGRCEESGVGGRFSGDVGCIMRTPPQVFIPHGFGHRHERWFATELEGTSVCLSRAGTGVNAGGASSRYGDAAEGRGACAKRVCVNDNHVHQSPAAPTCTLVRTTL